MKAWDDVVCMHERFICNTINSQFFIENGCKIEKFNNGMIVIKNTMTNHDHYEDIHPDVLNSMETLGWQAGTYMNALKVYQRRLDKVEYLMSLCLLDDHVERKEQLNEQRKRLVEKVRENYEKYTECNMFADPNDRG